MLIELILYRMLNRILIRVNSLSLRDLWEEELVHIRIKDHRLIQEGLIEHKVMQILHWYTFLKRKLKLKKRK